MGLTLIPGQVTLATLCELALGDGAAALNRGARADVEAAAAIVARAAQGEAPVYGVNTGFGKLASTRIPPADTARLQRNLVLSHCAGVGDPLPARVVRLAMALKLNSLGRGASGVTWDLVEALEGLLARGVTPVVPAQGSVGASGDLAPLAHIAAVLIGEGTAEMDGHQLPAARALAAAGLAPLVLGPKEGLALLNGTQVSTALALDGLFAAWANVEAALVTGALSTDAAMGSGAPFRPEVHALRSLQGQIDAARTLRALMNGSAIRESHRDDDERVQDPHCIRCQPQVMGACIDILRQAAVTLTAEANAVTDNPLVFVADAAIVSGGNFHAEPVAMAADQIALAVAEIGTIAQRRIALLVDPALSTGLPPFLSPDPGVNSGFMTAEITAAALMSENKQRAVPCSIDSTPTSANQEDHVSMATHAARRLTEMTRNLSRILGIELLAAAQGVEMRAPLATSDALQRVVDRVRQDVPALGPDRYMADDLERAAGLVRTRALVPPAGAELLPRLGDGL